MDLEKSQVGGIITTMIEDNIISLCVVGRKNDKPAFYRVADYNTESNSFEAVDISEQKIKYVYSKNSYISRIDEKYPIGELVLREWEYELSENGTVYTSSIPYDCVVPIEFIFDNSIYNAGLDHKQLLRKLRDGIAFDEHTSEKILLVLESTSDHYKALYIERSMMKINAQGNYYFSGNCTDMEHTKHLLTIYYISKEDVISTKSALIGMRESSNLDERLFYKKIEFDSTVESFSQYFHLFSLSEYYAVFFRRYLKAEKRILELTNKEISAFAGLIDLIQSKDTEIRQFLAVTKYTEDEITDFLYEIKERLIKDLRDGDVLIQYVRSTLENDPEFEKLCVQRALESWLAEKNEEQQRINNEIEKQQHQCTELSKQIGELQSKKLSIERDTEEASEILANCNAQIDETVRSLNNIKKQKEKLEHDIQVELTLFKDNLAHMAAVSFLSGIDNHSVKKNVPSVYVDIPDLELSEDIAEIEDIDELQDCIADNLENLCVLKKGLPFEVAKLMVAQICMHGSFIIYGNTARSIADCISLSVYGQRAAFVTLPLNAADIPAVINEITAIDRTVICVENAFDSYNDYIALTLLRRNCGKIFVFVVNNKSSLNLLKDSNVWEYAVYLNIDHIAECGSYAEVIPTLFTFPDTQKNSDTKKSNFDCTYKEMLSCIHASPSLKRRLKSIYDCYVSSELLDYQGEFYGVELLLSGMAKDELLAVTNEKFDAAFKELRTKAYNFLKEYREN